MFHRRVRVYDLVSVFFQCHQFLVASVLAEQLIFRVPTRPGKPGKMRVNLENLEISWNFKKINKYHGKMT